MARTFQRVAIVGAILASMCSYLWQAPNSEGIEQMPRVRSLGAMMKIAHLIGVASEAVGVSDRVMVIRNFGKLTKLLKSPEEDVGVQIENTMIENVPVRIARPLNGKSKLPAVVYFHGGAYYMGSLDTHNAITSGLARLANVVVISVDYRLAPEHPFPAGLDDSYAVAKYVLEHGDSDKLRIDPSRVALAGDSAGGALATVVAMRFATNPVGKHSPRTQILLYPVLQLFDLMLPSYMQDHFQPFHYTVDHTLSLYLNQNIDQSIYGNNHTTVQQKQRYRQYVDWSLIPSKYRKVYKKSLTDDHEGDPVLIERAKLALNPEISPLLVDDAHLAKLPPTYILSVGHDRLRDESFIYEGRLRKNGVAVVHSHYANAFHAILGFQYGPFGLDIAHVMLTDVAKYIREKL